MIQIQSFEFNAFAENTYVLYDESQEGLIIDPGCHDARERAQLDTFIREQGIKPVKLINTHCHIDHVLGNQYVKDTYQIELYIHQKDEEVLKANVAVSQLYGIQPYVPSEPDHFLEEGDVLTFGQSELDILFVPGHAPGHIALVSQAQKFVIGGDVLFRQSIGRYDLPGSNYEDLMHSIRQKLLTLPDDFTVYCGHGPETTIGHEKKFNPFL